MTGQTFGQLLAGVIVGGLWNAASLWCLARLLGAWLGPSPSRRKVVGWLLVKFPALYLFAFLALHQSLVSPLGFGIGFSLVLLGALWVFALRARSIIPSHS